jgi:hypothetical protein
LNPASESAENDRPFDARFKVRKLTKALSRLSNNNDRKRAPALGRNAMMAIGGEHRIYADIIAEGCRNVLPRSYAS